MDKNEIEELESQVLTTKQKDLSEAEKKRRKLEENMRREKEERSKKRQELLKKEDDYEKVCQGQIQEGGGAKGAEAPPPS